MIILLLQRKYGFLKMNLSIVKIILIILFFLSSIQLSSQPKNHHTITGNVYDEESGEPIPFVNVFLDGTTLGSSTDQNGKYIISNIPRGAYRIIVSMIGYQRDDRDLQLFDKSTITINFELTTYVYKLEEINVTTERDYDWVDDADVFRKNFLGSSNNSSECKIVNEEILEFIKSDDFHLKAKAPEPLVIINKSLGYKVIFDLKNFVLSNDNEVNYFGNIRFEELIPETDIQELDWGKRREEAYFGSFRHFLVSLCKGELRENGYYVYKVDYPDWNDLRRHDFLNPNLTEIVERVTTIERILKFNDYLMVAYMNEWEEKRFQTYRNYLGSKIFRELDYQTSWVKLPYGAAMFDIHGNIADKFQSIKVFGYWGWQKVADLLPINYVPNE